MLSKTALDSMYTGLLSNKSSRQVFTVPNLISLNEDMIEILSKEPSVLDLDGPIHICGDVHGQFIDLLRTFQSGGFPPDARYLFLGDYVDRGKQSLEVITLLYCLKIKFPDNIYLLRGNHESPEMTEFFGFLLECKQKASVQVWKSFIKSFKYLPIAAVISNKYFCIHGGISPELTSIQQIREIRRPLDIPEQGMIANLFWSDPDSAVTEYGPNERGTTICYGLNPVEKFLKANKLSMIVRGHQMASEGYDFPFRPNKSCVTVFTASKYAGLCDNKAAYMSILDDDSYKFTVLPSWVPVLEHTRRKDPHPSTPRKRQTNSSYMSTITPSTPRGLSLGLYSPPCRK